jgi:glycine/D-amino acid oxidase-like deaminating enzyme
MIWYFRVVHTFLYEFRLLSRITDRSKVPVISPERANRLNPFLKPTGVGAMRIGDDRYFDPAQVAIGYARAAAARGATLLRKSDALAVNIKAGKVAGVTTAKGTIEFPNASACKNPAHER